MAGNYCKFIRPGGPSPRVSRSSGRVPAFGFLPRQPFPSPSMTSIFSAVEDVSFHLYNALPTGFPSPFRSPYTMANSILFSLRFLLVYTPRVLVVLQHPTAGRKQRRQAGPGDLSLMSWNCDIPRETPKLFDSVICDCSLLRGWTSQRQR